MARVLRLDIAGTPQEWISIKEAVKYYAEDMVAYELGNQYFTYRGGISRLTNRQSRIDACSIISVKGHPHRWDNDRVPPLTNDTLFARDLYLCAYCGEQFSDRLLSREHVRPLSKGGIDVWKNVVTACKRCNLRKADRTPEQAGMQLLYVPYEPNRYEDFILQNRNILADQMEFLIRQVPRHSRQWQKVG